MGKKYGTKRNVEQVAHELSNIEKIESNPYLFGSIDKKQEFYKVKERLKKEREAITPPPVKDDIERKKLEARREVLREFIVNPCPEIKKPGMPSEKDQWDRVSGAVGYHRAHSHAIHHFNVNAQGKVVSAQIKPGESYSASDEYADISRRLDGEMEEFDPDFASLERLRPTTSPHSCAMDYRKTVHAPGQGVSEEKFEQAVAAVPDVTCKGTSASGKRCGRTRINKDGYCFQHAYQKPSEESEQPAEAAEQSNQIEAS